MGEVRAVLWVVLNHADGSTQQSIENKQEKGVVTGKELPDLMGRFPAPLCTSFEVPWKPHVSRGVVPEPPTPQGQWVCCNLSVWPEHKPCSWVHLAEPPHLPGAGAHTAALKTGILDGVNGV